MVHHNHKQFLPWQTNRLSRPLIYHAPNNIFLHRRRRSHAITTPYRRRKNNGENQSRLRAVTVCSLTFFQLNCYFRSCSAIRDISAYRRIFAAAASARLCLLKQSGDAKRTMRIICFLTILDFFHSPFFQ